MSFGASAETVAGTVRVHSNELSNPECSMTDDRLKRLLG